MPDSCLRGCVEFRRHLQVCRRGWLPAELGDSERERLMDGDRHDVSERARVWVGRYGGLEVYQDCRGCLPRDAKHGHLCDHCHDRLSGWLGEVGWLFRWLAANVAPGSAAGAKQDWQRPGGQDGSPAPVRVAVLDVRNLLTDRLLELEDCARDVFDRPARRDRFSITAAVDFLTAWLTKIEEDLDLISHMFDLLEDVFRRARQVAPWEDRPRRISGIICPHCERATLEVKPGREDVSCRTCRAVITRARYDIWTKMLAAESMAAS